MKGDAILVDLDRVARDPWIDPELDIADAFVERAMGADVATVVVGGKIVIENHQPRTIDVEGLYREVREFCTKGLTPEQRSTMSGTPRIGTGSRLTGALRQGLRGDLPAERPASPPKSSSRKRSPLVADGAESTLGADFHRNVWSYFQGPLPHPTADLLLNLSIELSHRSRRIGTALLPARE
jgi:hypothetical protein